MRELKNLRRTCKNAAIFWCFFFRSNRCLVAEHKTDKGIKRKTNKQTKAKDKKGNRTIVS